MPEWFECPATPSEAIAVRRENLGLLADRVTIPIYDRSELRRGVVHFGVGGFHRAHQAVYFDDIATRRVSKDWGITGVGLRSWQMGVVLRAQDHLYTLIERGEDGSTGRLVGSIVDYVHGIDEPERLLKVLADPATELVTLTITGNGYNLDEHGEFVADGDGVARDLANPQRPTTVFGFIVEGLDRRRRNGTPPFTVLSCDNIPQNGNSARAMVVGFASLRDETLARWIDERGAFPSSMVDRITPETTPEQRDELVHTLGVDCRWPVIAEPFSQWVVEDTFALGRPPLDEVGGQFVADVSPFEVVKKRLLNGTHCAIGYLGSLAGHRTSADVMEDPMLARFVAGFLREVVPLVPSPPGLDPEEYAAAVEARLQNPEIADDLGRLCRRGSVKVPSYLLPSLADAVDRRHPHPLVTLATAGYIRYLADESMDVVDPQAEELVELARRSQDDPRPLLARRDLFGDLADSEAAVAELRHALAALREGPHAAIRTHLDQQRAA